MNLSTSRDYGRGGYPGFTQIKGKSLEIVYSSIVTYDVGVMAWNTKEVVNSECKSQNVGLWSLIS